MVYRLSLIVACVATLLFLIISYPALSFELFAGILITFSTTSTLIFFAFAATALVFGFDRAQRRQVVQAQPAHQSLGDEYVS